MRSAESDLLLLVYAPWCAHCKALAPSYAAVAQRFAAEPRLTVARLDGTAGTLPLELEQQWDVRGYPALLWLSAEQKTGATASGTAALLPARYEGQHTEAGLVRFVVQHSSFGVEEPPESGKPPCEAIEFFYSASIEQSRQVAQRTECSDKRRRLRSPRARCRCAWCRWAGMRAIAVADLGGLTGCHPACGVCAHSQGPSGGHGDGRTRGLLPWELRLQLHGLGQRTWPPACFLCP